MTFAQDTIYFVESPQDDSVMLAMDAQLGEELVEWFDTVRDRAFPHIAYEYVDETLKVETEDATYYFRPLTVEIYNEKVAANVVGGRPFSSTDELQAYYRDFPR